MSHRTIGVALVCALSCAGPTHHAVIPPQPDDVEILWRAAGPHVDVATLDAPGLDVCGNALAKLRVRAGALGCDALVIGSDGSYAATCITYTRTAPESVAALPSSDSR